MVRELLIGIACTTVVVLLSGCAAASTTDNTSSEANSAITSPIATNRAAIAEDTAAFLVLGEIAPLSLKLEGGTVTSTACWTPSEHLFRDETIAPATAWKVLCRVYYTLVDQPRFQDATCIGDFALTPMLNHCYVWETYTGEAKFTDGTHLASPSPTSAP